LSSFSNGSRERNSFAIPIKCNIDGVERAELIVVEGQADDPARKSGDIMQENGGRMVCEKGVSMSYYLWKEGGHRGR
jgi:hypothetical protein